MITLTLKDIENRVAKNYIQNKNVADQVINQIKGRKLKQGRLRPKNPTEAKILARFTRS